MVRDIDFNELKMIIGRFSPTIVDVRDSDEYSIIHLKNSKSIPAEDLKVELANYDWAKPLVLVCRSGARSLVSASLLDAPERRIFNLKNGLMEIYRLGARDLVEVDADEDELKDYFS